MGSGREKPAGEPRQRLAGAGGAARGQSGGPWGPAMPAAGRLSVEPDYGGGTEFWHQASDLIPKQPCSGVSVLSHPRPPQIYLDLRYPWKASPTPGNASSPEPWAPEGERDLPRVPHLCGHPGAERAGDHPPSEADQHHRNPTVLPAPGLQAVLCCSRWGQPQPQSSWPGAGV